MTCFVHQYPSQYSVILYCFIIFLFSSEKYLKHKAFLLYYNLNTTSYNLNQGIIKAKCDSVGHIKNVLNSSLKMRKVSLAQF